MKQREDRDYQVISPRQLIPCVPFCLLSSEDRSLYNVFFRAYKNVDCKMNCFNSAYNLHA